MQNVLELVRSQKVVPAGVSVLLALVVKALK